MRCLAVVAVSSVYVISLCHLQACNAEGKQYGRRTARSGLGKTGSLQTCPQGLRLLVTDQPHHAPPPAHPTGPTPGPHVELGCSDPTQQLLLHALLSAGRTVPRTPLPLATPGLPGGVGTYIVAPTGTVSLPRDVAEARKLEPWNARAECVHMLLVGV